MHSSGESRYYGTPIDVVGAPRINPEHYLYGVIVLVCPHASPDFCIVFVGRQKDTVDSFTVAVKVRVYSFQHYFICPAFRRAVIQKARWLDYVNEAKTLRTGQPIYHLCLDQLVVFYPVAVLLGLRELLAVGHAPVLHPPREELLEVWELAEEPVFDGHELPHRVGGDLP